MRHLNGGQTWRRQVQVSEAKLGKCLNRMVCYGGGDDKLKSGLRPIGEGEKSGSSAGPTSDGSHDHATAKASLAHHAAAPHLRSRVYVPGVYIRIST